MEGAESLEIFKFFGVTGMSGVVVYVLWHLLTRVVPKQQEEFSKSLKEVIDSNERRHELTEKGIRDSRTEFREELAKERAHCDARHQWHIQRIKEMGS
jgi:hypothetical protein